LKISQQQNQRYSTENKYKVLKNVKESIIDNTNKKQYLFKFLFGLTNDRTRAKGKREEKEKEKEKAVVLYIGFDEKLGLVEKDIEDGMCVYKNI